MSEILIETHDLKKYFKTPAGVLHAVDSINIQIPKGKTLGVVGESGCGKSVTSLSLMQLLQRAYCSVCWRPPPARCTSRVKTFSSTTRSRCTRSICPCR